MLFVITDSQSCKDNFLSRIESIASAQPDRIILREKYLSPQEYSNLTVKCKSICQKYNVDFSVNTFTHIAEELNISDIHTPFFMLEGNPSLIKKFDIVGVSVHSVDEAIKAQKFGADYIIAGHIFATDCKRGIEPRGLDFLKKIKNSVTVPVLGIGGISLEKISSVMGTGADGICVMSHFMNCDNIKMEVEKFKALL